MTYDEINAIGTMLASLRDVHESAVTVAFTAHAGSTDTPNGSISATVSAAGFDATAEALRLADALSLARAKLRTDAQVRADDAAGKPRRGRGAVSSRSQGNGQHD